MTNDPTPLADVLATIDRASAAIENKFTLGEAERHLVLPLFEARGFIAAQSEELAAKDAEIARLQIINKAFLALKSRAESAESALAEARRDGHAKQARIDLLMMEYCPDEITGEQLEEWGKHQVPCSDEEGAAIDAALAQSGRIPSSHNVEGSDGGPLPLRCDRPTPGWYCGLARDHDGPCPAWPVSHATAAQSGDAGEGGL